MDGGSPTDEDGETEGMPSFVLWRTFVLPDGTEVTVSQ